jgi:hypothetical protein
MFISSSSFKPTPVPPLQGVYTKTVSPPPPPNLSSAFKTLPKTPMSIYIYPSGHYVTIPPAPDFETYYNSLHDFIRGYALPLNVNREYVDLEPVKAERLIKDFDYRHGMPWRTPVSDAMVLICGHGNRDSRCGVFGPLLQAEFEEKLEKLDVELLHDPPPFLTTNIAWQETYEWQRRGGDPALLPKLTDVKRLRVSKQRARVGQISHVGGHKFAGNVIIYIPHDEVWKCHPLAGKGIWYGRVEPWHVEGIIEETIKKGNVIKELFRGAVDRNGMPVWVDRLDVPDSGERGSGSRSIMKK